MLLESVSQTATKLSGDTRTGVLFARAKITPGPAQAVDSAATSVVDDGLAPENLEATAMGPMLFGDNLVPADDDPPHGSEDAEMPPSPAADTVLQESDIAEVVHKHPSSSLIRSTPTLGFPGLAILLPARLYGDDQEPTGSCVPFATDASTSQAHARRTFLHRPRTKVTSIRPVLPGTAIQRLGSSRVFDLLCVAPQTPSTAANAVKATLSTMAHIVSKTETDPGELVQIDSEADDYPYTAITKVPAPDEEFTTCDQNYNPLSTPLQYAGEGAVSYFDREPLLPIDDRFSEDGDEIKIELPSTKQTQTTLSTGETQVRITDTDRQLSDYDFRETTELSVSDVAEATQKETATFSDGVTALTTPVLEGLIDIQSSRSPSYGSLTVNSITKLMSHNVSDSIVSTPSTAENLDDRAWSRVVSSSSATSTTAASHTDPVTSNSIRAFQMSNTFLGSTCFSGIVAHLQSPSPTNYVHSITKPALARAFVSCVAAEHRDKLLFSPDVAAPGVTFTTKTDVEKATEFETQRRAKLGLVSLFEFSRMVEWDQGQTNMEGVWKAWREAAVKEQECERGVEVFI